MKTVKAMGRGHKAAYPLDYLNDMKTAYNEELTGVSKPQDLFNLDTLQKIMAQRSLVQVANTMLKFAKLTRAGTSQGALINEQFSQEV